MEAADRPSCPTKNLLPQFVSKYPDGRIAGIGAVSWYITLVTNTDVYPEPPTSWAALWDPANKDKLGLLALVSNSFLLEVTAKTFFGGHQQAGYRGRHPSGHAEAGRVEAQRPAVVPGRGPVRAGFEVGRDPDGPVLS